jgi:transcriptional regulator with XRE-family HTH domain
MNLDEAKGHHGKIIKYFRKDINRLTQEQLAEALGITTRWLQELETMLFILNTNTREALAMRLGIPRLLLNLEEVDILSQYGKISLDNWLVDSWENEMFSRWELYYASNSLITERGLLEQIRKLEHHADAGSRNQYRISGILSQDYQLAGSLAQKLLAQYSTVPVEKDMAHIRLTMESMDSTRGECSVLLGEPQKGLDYLQSAFRKLDLTMTRRRCRLSMQQAEAYLAAGQPDACVDMTLQGLRLAQALISNENVNWACEIHTKLLASRWQNEPMVGQLRKAIVTALQEMQRYDTQRK